MDRVSGVVTSWDQIHGYFGFAQIYDEMSELFEDGFSCVEIGAYHGRSTAYMAGLIRDSGHKVNFHVVDTWEGSKEHDDSPEELVAAFKSNMADLGTDEYINMMHMTSLEAAKKFEDESLDFVLIDGSHQYEDVLNDIKAWLPKVKPGGVLAGDDYNWTKVERAVKEVFDVGGMRIIPKKNTDCMKDQYSGGTWIWKKPEE